MNVKDATRTRLSSPPVIEADRVGAVACSPTRCVGANALRRMRGVLDVKVGATIMRLKRRTGWERWELDPNTKVVVEAYDTAGELMPIGFVFHFVPPAKPLGSRAGEPSGSDRRSGANTSVASRKPSHRHIGVEPL
jgi:hypothetical protein